MASCATATALGVGFTRPVANEVPTSVAEHTEEVTNPTGCISPPLAKPLACRSSVSEVGTPARLPYGSPQASTRLVANPSAKVSRPALRLVSIFSVGGSPAQVAVSPLVSHESDVTLGRASRVEVGTTGGTPVCTAIVPWPLRSRSLLVVRSAQVRFLQQRQVLTGP